jgi:hypothetical protein
MHSWSHVLTTHLLIVTAHRGVWRNGLLFSPSTKYGSYSYADVMIRPLAEALRDALAAAAQVGKLATPADRARPVVYVALTGEQGRQVTWSTLLKFADRVQRQAGRMLL